MSDQTLRRLLLSPVARPPLIAPRRGPGLAGQPSGPGTDGPVPYLSASALDRTVAGPATGDRVEMKAAIEYVIVGVQIGGSIEATGRPGDGPVSAAAKVQKVVRLFNFVIKAPNFQDMFYILC